jgi:chorismate--pyruvate lyase
MPYHLTPPFLNPNMLALLTDDKSLTSAFQQIIGKKPTLTCLVQKKELIRSNEKKALSLHLRQYAHIREILMGTKEQNWIFARTIIPLATLKKNYKRLAQLNSTSLGTILFKPNVSIRVSMKISFIRSDHSILSILSLKTKKLLCQRTSLFQLKSGPLLVREIFLPQSPIYRITNNEIK